MRNWEVHGTSDMDPFWAALERSGLTREDINAMFVNGSHQYPCEDDRCKRCPVIRKH